MRQMRITSPVRHALIIKLAGLFFPTLCPVCGKNSDLLKESPFCSGCWSLIARYSGPHCRICSLPLPSEYASVCGTCLKETPPFSRAMTFGVYEGVLAEAIHQLKFYGQRRLAQPLGALLFTLDFPAVDGIVPVPLHRRNLRKRGFNQSLLLARILSRKLGVPLFMDILTKTRLTPPQVGLSAKERVMNIRNAFAVNGHIKNLRLFLVDDVMTTGATVSECSKQLRKAGAKEVIVLTLARAGIL
jgi:ComF family protein